jgi:TPR repeat protein
MPGDLDLGVAAAERGNFAEAFCHWRPLAETGHAEAQYRLAWLYAKGLGLTLNPGRALELWRAAADQGHAEAQFRVGWVHANGEGTKKDEALAAEWYFKAAQQGHEDAQELFRHLWKRGSTEGKQRADALVKASPGVFKSQPRIKSGANLRAEANAKAKLIAKLAPGDAVEVLERKGGWIKVRVAAGDSGWIAASSVNEDAP